MPEEWIRFREGNTETAIIKIRVEPSTIVARIEPIGTLLDIPLAWEWVGPPWLEKQLFWEMVSLSVELLWTDKARLISVSLPANAVDGNPPRNLLFPLNLTQVEEVETLRAANDATLLLKITAHVQLGARTNLARPNIGSAISQVVMRAYQSQIAIPIIIPKSMWENNIQPYLGLYGLSSLTITFPPGTQKVFVAPLYELQRAEKTLRTASTEEQFESVVLQCRNAIDSLLNQFSFQLANRADGKPDASFRARVDALGTQYLADVLSESQVESVCNILYALWVPYSGATKPGQPHHTRAYATFALHQAAAVVKLISEALWMKQRLSSK
jgi:hypothetical protein